MVRRMADMAASTSASTSASLPARVSGPLPASWPPSGRHHPPPHRAQPRVKPVRRKTSKKPRVIWFVFGGL
eukprot:9483355-Pyramimonas_sp.AAC.1